MVSPVNAGVAARANGMLQFTPASNFHGTVVITYTADDGDGGTDHATLTITVTPESIPPVAVAPGVAFSARVASTRPCRSASRGPRATTSAASSRTSSR